MEPFRPLRWRLAARATLLVFALAAALHPPPARARTVSSKIEAKQLPVGGRTATGVSCAGQAHRAARFEPGKRAALRPGDDSVTIKRSDPTVACAFVNSKSESLNSRSEDGESMVKVCEVAGDGVDIGTLFDYDIISHERPLIWDRPHIPAGPAPGGYCVLGSLGLHVDTSVSVAPGDAPGYVVANRTGVPMGSSTYDPSSGAISMKTVSGITEVTITHKRSGTGSLTLCVEEQEAAAGPYTFTIAGAAGPIGVPAGLCSASIQVPSGQTIVRRTGGAFTIARTFPEGRERVWNGQPIAVMVTPGDASTQTIAFVSVRD